MVKVVYPESYDEFDELNKQAVAKGFNIFPVCRHPFFPSKKTGKYDIYNGRGYLGAVAISGNNRYYYLLDFGKIKSRYYEQDF